MRFTPLGRRVRMHTWTSSVSIVVILMHVFVPGEKRQFGSARPSDGQ